MGTYSKFSAVPSSHATIFHLMNQILHSLFRKLSQRIQEKVCLSKGYMIWLSVLVIDVLSGSGKLELGVRAVVFLLLNDVYVLSNICIQSNSVYLQTHTYTYWDWSCWYPHSSATCMDVHSPVMDAPNRFCTQYCFLKRHKGLPISALCICHCIML